MEVNNKNEKIRKFNLASRIQSLYILSELKSKYDNVLDLGAGDGEITYKIKRMGVANKIYAVDNDSIRIDRIKKRLEKNMENIIINQCFAQKLPYEKDFFDLIICNSVIEHIDDYHLIISEIKRVIKKNGTLIITVPNRDMQFGTINNAFWKFVLTRSNRFKSKLCRNDCLSKMDKIEDVQNYLNDYFSHKIQFNIDKVKNDFFDGFELSKTIYFMCGLSGFFHDLAYYFKIFDKYILLKLCYIVGLMEFKFTKNKKGKGLLAVFISK